MNDVFALIIPVSLLIIFAILWVMRPKAAFKAPETQAFNPVIFKSYQVRNSLFVNTSEQALFAILDRYLTPKYRVFSKVRLEDVISVKPGQLDPKITWSLRGRVKSRHVDFLITTPYGKPLMMIELDGKSHQSQQALRPDQFKNGLAKSVGLPLRRVKTGQDFHQFVQKIKIEISQF